MSVWRKIVQILKQSEIKTRKVGRALSGQYKSQVHSKNCPSNRVLQFYIQAKVMFILF